MKRPILYLKFGSINGGDYKDSPKSRELADKLNSIDDDMIRMCVEIQIIELFNGKIFNWWANKYVSKKQAKEYITNYETVKEYV